VAPVIGSQSREFLVGDMSLTAVPLLGTALAQRAAASPRWPRRANAWLMVW
jgi:hypothetical protein